MTDSKPIKHQQPLPFLVMIY